MKFSEGMAVIEAVCCLRAASQIDAAKLSEACEIEKDTVLKIIDRLNDRYTENGSAFRISRLGDSYQMIELSRSLRRISKPRWRPAGRYRCPQAAMEVLAVVACDQPVAEELCGAGARSRQLRRCEQPCGARSTRGVRKTRPAGTSDSLQDYGELSAVLRAYRYKGASGDTGQHRAR